MKHSLSFSLVFLLLLSATSLFSMNDALVKNQDKKKSAVRLGRGSVWSFKRLIEDALTSKPERELFLFFSPLFDELAEQKEFLKLEALAEVLIAKIAEFSPATATAFEDYMQCFLTKYKVLMAQPCFKKINEFSLALKKRVKPNAANATPAQNVGKNEHRNLNEPPVGAIPSSIEKMVGKYGPITTPADLYEDSPEKDSPEKMQKDYEKRQARKALLLANYKKSQISIPQSHNAYALENLKKAEDSFIDMMLSVESAHIELPKWTAKRVAAQGQVASFLQDAKRPLNSQQKDLMIERFSDLYHQIKSEQLKIYSLDDFIAKAEEALLRLKKARISYQQHFGFDLDLAEENCDIEDSLALYANDHLSALTKWHEAYREYVKSYQENTITNLEEHLNKYQNAGREALLSVLAKSADEEFTREVVFHFIESRINPRFKLQQRATVGLDLFKAVLQTGDAHIKKAYETLLKQALSGINRMAKIAAKYENMYIERCIQELNYIERLYQKYDTGAILPPIQACFRTKRLRLQNDKQVAQKFLAKYKKVLSEIEGPFSEDRLPTFLKELQG